MKDKSASTFLKNFVFFLKGWAQRKIMNELFCFSYWHCIQIIEGFFDIFYFMCLYNRIFLVLYWALSVHDHDDSVKAYISWQVCLLLLKYHLKSINP